MIQKWEYLMLQASSNYGSTKFYVNGELQSALKNHQLPGVINQIGSMGWEMVGITTDKEGTTYFFKRPAVKKTKTLQTPESA